MKTTFGLFSAYSDAEQAVEALLDLGWDEEDVNVIVQEQIAKNYLDVNLGQINVTATDEVSEKKVRGLDAILGTQRPVTVEGEDLYAAGKLATVLVTTATAPGAVEGQLKAALTDFGVPERVAEIYDEGIHAGSVLLWVRADDERASQVKQVMREQGGEQVVGYAG
jgi:hypothetical protein